MARAERGTFIGWIVAMVMIVRLLRSLLLHFTIYHGFQSIGTGLNGKRKDEKRQYGGHYSHMGKGKELMEVEKCKGWSVAKKELFKKLTYLHRQKILPGNSILPN